MDWLAYKASASLVIISWRTYVPHFIRGIVGYKLDRMGALWEFIIMCVCNVVITFFWHMKTHSGIGFLPTVL